MSADYEKRFRVADRYLRFVDQSTHPFVKEYFFQVTELLIKISDTQDLRLAALEFRRENRAIFAWQDDQGNWGAGIWVDLIYKPISYANPADQYSIVGMLDSDYELPPIPLSYFKNARAFVSLEALVDELSRGSKLA